MLPRFDAGGGLKMVGSVAWPGILCATYMDGWMDDWVGCMHSRPSRGRTACWYLPTTCITNDGQQSLPSWVMEGGVRASSHSWGAECMI